MGCANARGRVRGRRPQRKQIGQPAAQQKRALRAIAQAVEAGAGGRITKEDLENYLAASKVAAAPAPVAAPAPAPVAAAAPPPRPPLVGTSSSPRAPFASVPSPARRATLLLVLLLLVLLLLILLLLVLLLLLLPSASP